MAKLIKSLGLEKTFNRKNNQLQPTIEKGSDADSCDVATLQRSRYCGWSAIIDFPQRRRHSEFTQSQKLKNPNQNFKCEDKFKKDALGANMHVSHLGCCNSLHGTSTGLPKKVQTRASISFDSTHPKLLDFYSDPADVRNGDKSPASRSMHVTMPDEDYSVPYQIACSKEATYEEPWDLTTAEQNLFNKMSKKVSSSPSKTNSSHAPKKSSATVVDGPSETSTNFNTLDKSPNNDIVPTSSKSVTSTLSSLSSVFSPCRTSAHHHRCCNHTSHHRHYSYRLTKQERQNIINHKCISAPQMIIHQKETKCKSKDDSKQEDETLECSTMDGTLRRGADDHPLYKYNWFHGLLSRQEAELLLRDAVEGSYLVRISESNNKDYSLSLRSDSGYLHIKIIISCDNTFILGQFSQPFVSVASIIDFFASNKLPIKGTRHILLSHPIPHPSRQLQ